MIKTIEMDLEFAPIIPNAPVAPKSLWNQACANDEITIDTWKDTWVECVKKNHKLKGPFGPASIGRLHGSLKGQTTIIVGSGPSLKGNIKDLVEASKHAPVLSCLHNFHYLEDHGVNVDYYVTLDSGPITVTEVYQGGTRTEEEYWSLTKEKTLLAFIGANPELISKWQGKILWFHCPIPDPDLMRRIAEVEVFSTLCSTGGNVLGSTLYAAKAIMGAAAIVFVGADFSFSYTKKFHAWDSPYDKDLGHAFKVTDVFGNKTYTWQSYFNFKAWFDYVATIVPGIYINATEGGCLGAYPDGNIRQIIQMSLKEVATMLSNHEHTKEQCDNPGMDISSPQSAKLLF